MPAGDLQIPTNYCLMLGAGVGQPEIVGVTGGGDLRTFAHRHLTFAIDDTLDDVDKTVIVPAARIWWVHSINVTLVTSATVGDRLIRIDTLSSGIVGAVRSVAGVVQVASTTGHYSFFPGAPRDTAFNDQDVSAPIPTRLLLDAGAVVRVREINAVSVGFDDMLTQIVYDEITV